MAQSQPSEAPPGNSAVDQYRESLPPASSNTRKLSRKDRSGLERQGSDGEALAAVLERSGGVPQASTPAANAGDSPQHSRRSTDATSGRSSTSDQASSDRTSTGGPVGEAAANGPGTRSIAPAAASSTVGPVPVWVLLVAAAGLLGVGVALRGRVAR